MAATRLLCRPTCRDGLPCCDLGRPQPRRLAAGTFRPWSFRHGGVAGCHAGCREAGRTRPRRCRTLGGRHGGPRCLADGSDLGRIALVGPTLSMEDLVAPRARSQGWGARTQAAFWRLLDARGAFTVDALSSLKQVRSPLGSALLVHDRDDQEYPFEPVRNLQAQWPGAAVHRTDGLGHHHILWNDHVVQRVAEFMAQGGHPEDR